MTTIDTKYINRLSSKVRNFKQISHTTWRFSCCFCGDSAKNLKKARGNIYVRHQKMHYKCFNCGVTKSLPEVFKHICPVMFASYSIDKYSSGAPLNSLFKFYE